MGTEIDQTGKRPLGRGRGLDGPEFGLPAAAGQKE